jgi:serine-type D-Ala-D-Ala carboxypeptidase/endopeptidase (penicillin-binding protein 4)
VAQLAPAPYPAMRVVATTVAAPVTRGAGDLPPDSGRTPTTSLSVVTDPEYGPSVTGTIAVGDSATLTVAHRDVAAAYLAALSIALGERGIALGGGTDARVTAAVPVTGAAPLDTLFSLASPPLREVLPHLQKPSQNQIAEVLLKTLGLERTGVGSADSGRRVIESQLVAWGADPEGFAVRDGSGLSRHDYVSPETVVRVLEAMRRSPDFAAYYDALPIAGVDGTIATRMRGTPAQGNVHAKTGYVDRARSLSGYVHAADGELLLFSLLCNNWTTSVRAVERVQDEIAVRLAMLPVKQR